jgi:hypothetical protein
MGVADVRAALAPLLSAEAAEWLRAAEERVGRSPGAVAAVFPAAGRRCGRGPLRGAPPPYADWTVDDAARAVLLAALPLSGADLAAAVCDLYRHGDAAERRGVLRALALLDGEPGGVGGECLPVVRDALRSNDTRLVAAALGPYAAHHLDPAAYRHGVLKCVFTGVPLSRVDGLDRRLDAELVRMLRSYAEERRAAGRPVPPDVLAVLAGNVPAGDRGQ